VSIIVLGVLALAYYYFVENLENVETQKYYVEKKEWLVANNYDPTGESFFVGYNSPFKIYNRRNEILIALN
jgi:hypothetical protein